MILINDIMIMNYKDNNMNINNNQNFKIIDNTLKENKFNNIKIEKKEQINLFYWNAWSINSMAKKTICKAHNPQIIILNEPWEKWESIHFRSFYNDPPNGKHNVGIIVRDPNLQAWRINCNWPNPNLLITRVGRGASWVFIIVIYLTPTDAEANKITRIDLMQEINAISWAHPNDPITVIGDFNCNLTAKNRKKPSKKDLIKTLNTKGTIHSLDKVTCNRTNKNGVSTESQIDWLWTWKTEVDKISSNNISKKHSDHTAFEIQISFGKPSIWNNIEIPNKKAAKEVETEFLEKVKNGANPDLFTLNSIIITKKITKTIKDSWKFYYSDQMEIIKNQSDKDKIEWMLWVHYKELINKMIWKRFSKDSKEAWNFIKKFCKYNLFEKRDGGIANVVKDEFNQIIVDKDKVDRLILDNFEKIHGKSNISTNFPSVNKPSEEEAKAMSLRFNPNKAITLDLVPHSLLKTHKKCAEGLPCENCKIKIKLIQNSFDPNYWNNPISNIHKQNRLIPLSKTFPEIGTPDQIWPIIIQSPLFKLIELYFAGDLKEAQDKHIQDSQCGFWAGWSFQTQVLRLLSYLKFNKKAKWILSIDQSAAYNRVNRNKFYKIIKKNKILTDDKLALMKFHHSQPMIVLGKHRTKPLNSLSQGAVTSPHGFNLYINS